MELIDAAADYLGMGLRVIALTGKTPNGKVHPHWKDDCFVSGETDGTLRHAFSHPDTTGVGILTGYPNYVVDIDGEDGARAWRNIMGKDFIPKSWVASTGRGYHLWFRHYEDWPTAKLGEQLDFKGRGGYVAAPPSLHPSGRRYEWMLPPGDDIPWVLPDQVEAILVRQRADRKAAMANKAEMRVRRDHPLVDGMLYPVSTFEGIIDRVRAAEPGNRNHLLYWAARTMLEEGADREDLEELLDAGRQSGLDRAESRRTVRSAVEAHGG